MKTVGFFSDSKEKITNVIPFDFLHGFVSGATGSGKTASVIRPTLKDRIKRGNSVIFYAYKGHEHRYIKQIASEARRLEDVVEIGKPFGAYINVLDLLDSRLLEKMIKEQSRSKDPYWTNTTAKWVVSIFECLQAMYNIQDYVDKKYGDIEIFSKKIKEVFPFFGDKPSFRNIRDIVKSPDSFKEFTTFLNITGAYDRLMKKVIEKECERLSKSNSSIDENEVERLVSQLFVKIEEYYEAIKGIKDITINTENLGETSGNNGVLQVVYNSILSLAKKDFINEAENDLLDMIENKKIIIIDTESLSSDIHSIFLESFLEKLSLRVRNSKLTPVSIIVDEANRVYPENSDIYNDVLREAKVELILAFQSEHQMIEKFGYEKWSAFNSNFKHKYAISADHRLSYNGTFIGKFEPYIVEKDELDDAEVKFNTLETNLNQLKKRFYIFQDIPQSFIIDYSIKRFENDRSIDIISLDTEERIKATYLPDNKKEKIKKLVADVLKTYELTWFGGYSLKN